MRVDMLMQSCRIIKSSSTRPAIFLLLLLMLGIGPLMADQPAEPTDISPIDGESYYLINQLSGLQVDLNNGSTTTGDAVVVASRSFTSLTQRWALTRISSGKWAISNLSNGLCLDSVTSSSATSTVQNTCDPASSTQLWSMAAASNGYVTLTNQGSGLVLDVSGGSATAGTALVQSAASSAPTQSQQWLLRPVFFRGIDNSLLEKQEQIRTTYNLPWWNDAGNTQDILQIFKNHGINMLRIRPTPPTIYGTYTVGSQTAIPASCSNNGCYAETEAADLDLAKRAKALGMSVQLTLFFDGGSSTAVPGAWSSYSLAQIEQAVYDYVYAEVESYRAAGVMPDMIAIGNEVDTGLFSTIGSPTSTNFPSFAAIESKAMQAVSDASADTSIGAALPMPLRCIHITPSWDPTDFFATATKDGVPYDAICESYYPIYHGPLTAAQAAKSNPANKTVEQTALTTAANSIGKPIFLIEVGEHYESGYGSNDTWYASTIAGQRQFLIDVNSVLKALPHNLGMGFEYWDATGVDLSDNSGSTAANGKPDALYKWNGLTLFDNADTTGSALSTAANFGSALSGLDALGGKMDASLNYRLVNAATGNVLEASVTGSATILDTATNSGALSSLAQWAISSNGDGYLQIANAGITSTTAVLDNLGVSTAGSAVTIAAAGSSDSAQEWNLVTAGNGYYALVNKSSGLVLAEGSSNNLEQQAPTTTATDWVTPASQAQMWQVMPAHITAASSTTATPLSTSTTLAVSASTLYAGQSVTLTATVKNGSSTVTEGSVDFLNGSTDLGSATVSSSGSASLTFTPTEGSYTITAVYSGSTNYAGSTSASSSVTVNAASFSVASSATSLTLSSGSSTTLTFTVTPAGSYAGTITLACSSTLSSVSCSANPASITLSSGSTAQSATITVKASSTTAALRREDASGMRMAGLGWGVFLLLPCMLLVRRKGVRQMLLAPRSLVLALLMALAMSMVACGGGAGSGSTSPTTKTGTITITAAASTGSVVLSKQINVTVD